MALSLMTLGNSIVTSIRGRKLGLDKDGYLVGAPGIKKEILDLTSASTGVTIPPNSIVRLALTTLSTQSFKLPHPQPSQEIIAFLGYNQAASTVVSSAAYLSVASGDLICSTEGSTMGAINLSSYSMVSLIGLSTALWGVNGRSESTAATYAIAST